MNKQLEKNKNDVITKIADNKQLIKDLRSAISQNYLYNSDELKYMQEQLDQLELSVKRIPRTKPKGFGEK